MKCCHKRKRKRKARSFADGMSYVQELKKLTPKQHQAMGSGQTRYRDLTPAYANRSNSQSRLPACSSCRRGDKKDAGIMCATLAPTPLIG